MTAPAQATDFDWSITGATLSKNCKATGTRYLDLREFLVSMYSAGTASGTTAQCTWNSLGPNAITCQYSNPATVTTAKSFTRYTNSSCTTLTTPATRNIKTTSVTVTIDATCNSAPALSYTAASASDFARWKWQCSSVTGSKFFDIAIAYGVYTTAGTLIGSETAVISGASRAASVNRMRYQPLMPFWFYQNEWYKSAFAAVAPAKAPGAVAPCGAATSLTVGGNTSVDALVMLAGRQLAGTSPPQAVRPAASPNDYLETPNNTGGTNCAFSASSAAVTNTANDQVLVVAP